MRVGGGGSWSLLLLIGWPSSPAVTRDMTTLLLFMCTWIRLHPCFDHCASKRTGFDSLVWFPRVFIKLSLSSSSSGFPAPLSIDSRSRSWSQINKQFPEGWFFILAVMISSLFTFEILLIYTYIYAYFLCFSLVSSCILYAIDIYVLPIWYSSKQQFTIEMQADYTSNSCWIFRIRLLLDRIQVIDLINNMKSKYHKWY